MFNRTASTRQDQLDLAMVVTVVVLFAALGLTIARGDQVGLSVARHFPDTSGSPGAIIEMALDEPVTLDAVQPYFSINPPVTGELTVTDRLVRFRPLSALKIGERYTVTLRAGIVSATTDRDLKQDFSFTYNVRSPRVAYLAPVNDPVQNIFMTDPTTPDAPPVQLTQSARGVLSYDVSADGMQIVYAELGEMGQARLMLWDARTGANTVLFPCDDAACQDPIFRPDSGGVAFQKQDLNSTTTMTPGVARPYVLDFANRAVTPLFDDSQSIGYDVRWSPDGKKIAVYSGSTGGIVVRAVDTTSGKIDPANDLFIPSENGENGKFAPDSQSLIYPVVLQPTQGIAVQHFIRADLTTNPPTQSNIVSDSDTANDVEATWYSDGKSLIVGRRLPYTAGKPPAGPQIYQLDLATGDAKPLVVDLGYSFNTLIVSPDGNELVYSRFTLNTPGARPEIWVYNFTTGSTALVANNASRPKWLP